MKRLAKSLEDSSWAASLVGPKIFRPRARKTSDDTGGKRGFGADDREAYAFPLGEAGERDGVGEVDIPQPGLASRSGVAGRDVNPLHAGRLRQAPGQGVFAAAGTDDE